jgi:hypothetical protein
VGRIAEYSRQNFGSSVDTGAIQRASSATRAIAGVAETVGSTAYAINQKHTEIKEKEYLAQKGLAFELEVSEAYGEHQKKYQGDPLNKFGDFKEQLTEIETKYRDQAPSHRSKRMFSGSTNLFRQRLESSNGTWENQRLAINTGERAQDGLEVVQTQAFRVADPRQLKSLLVKGDALMSPLNETHAPEKVAEAKEKFQFNAAMNSFEGMIMGGDINSAEALLNSKEYDGYLGDDGVKRVSKMIATQKRAKEKTKADLSRLKFSNPYKYLEKSGVKYDFFQMQNGQSAVATRTNFIDDMKSIHGVNLPFFAPDEIKLFKDNFDKGNNSERLNFLETIEGTPINHEGLYSQMGVPREIGFFKNFTNDSDKELFVQATLAKDIKPTEDAKSADIKTSVESSDFGSMLLDISSDMSANSGYRESSQNLLETMKRISILKNDPNAGADFFNSKFKVINNAGDTFGDHGMKVFVPKGVDEDQLEDRLEKIKNDIVNTDLKGLTSVQAYHKKKQLQNDTIWINSNNRIILLDKISGKEIRTHHTKGLSFDALNNKIPLKVRSDTPSITSNGNRRFK